MSCEEKTLEKLHNTSMRLLEEVGLAFHSESSLDLLKSAGFRVDGNRAFFTENQVMDAVQAAKKDFIVYARNPKYNVHMNTENTYVTPGYGSPSVAELDGTIRAATFDDFLKLANIVQVSDVFSINGGILAQPSDISEKVAAEAMVYATLVRSDKALFSVCGGGLQARRIMDMLRIVFGDLQDKPYSLNLISPQSPMSVPTNALETIDVCGALGQPLLIGPGPMAGGTGPIALAGNTVICNAEALGTNVYAQLVHPGTPVIYTHAATVSDMKDMNVSNACPGFLKQARWGLRLAKMYGFPARSAGGMSNAGGLTAQAGVESAMSLFHAFANKANCVMHATGSLHSFGTVSFEKFILDIETIDRLRYYLSDLAVDEDSLSFDTIRETVEEGELFMVAEQTLERCHTEPWQRMVSLHGKSNGEPNAELYASIQKKMAEMLEGYQKPDMDPGIKAELDAYLRSIGMEEADIARV